MFSKSTVYWLSLNRISKYSELPMRWWCWHLGQTNIFSRSSVTVQIKLQLGHLVQRPSGVSFFSAVLVRIPFLMRLNHPLLLSSLCPSSPARFASKSSLCFMDCCLSFVIRIVSFFGPPCSGSFMQILAAKILKT